jgi:CTP synthase
LNNNFREILEQKGMVMAGTNPERDLVEIVELKNHPFFVAVQFHPEFKSRPLTPHPLFREFIRACIKQKNPLPLAKGKGQQAVRLFHVYNPCDSL